MRIRQQCEPEVRKALISRVLSQARKFEYQLEIVRRQAVEKTAIHSTITPIKRVCETLSFIRKTKIKNVEEKRQITEL